MRGGGGGADNTLVCSHDECQGVSLAVSLESTKA
jgi:hypothetical protein